MPEADEIFEEFGLKDKSTEYIERQIKIKRTKLGMLLSDFEKDNQETANEDFYSLKARYVSVIGNIPVDVLLIEWIGIIDAIRKMNKTTKEK